MSVPVANRFTSLVAQGPVPVTAVSSKVERPTLTKKQKRKRRRPNKASKKAKADLVSNLKEKAEGTSPELSRPHQASLYLPVKVDRVASIFLVDSGCTTNILSKRIFDRLPKSVRAELQVGEANAGLLVDGSHLTLLGMIKLRIRVRAHQSEEVFWVSNIRDDGILGMPFLTEKECQIDFSSQRITIGRYEAQCTDRWGKPLAGTLQVVRKVEIPAGQEQMVLCRVPLPTSTTVGVVTGQCMTVSLAASLSQLNSDNQVLVRCLNWGSCPVTLPASKVVGLFSCVEDDAINMVTEARPTVKSESKGTCTVPAHLVDLFQRVGQTCQSQQQQQEIAALLVRYADVFSKGDTDMGSTGLVQHEIPILPGTTPVRQAARRLGPDREAEVERQVQDLHSRGLIEPANGGWSSPVVLVRKKDDTWRFCVDYRRLNSVTRQDAFPLPRIDESLDALAGSRFFSTLDLLSGYWQVPLSEDAQEKAAFVTRSGLWKWKVMPFGLTSAPATFQRLMEQVLRGLHWRTLLLYLDDVIVVAPTFESHIQRLAEVFDRLRSANLKLKPSKCDLFQEQVRYLGHIVSAQGVATDDSKVEAVKNWPEPNCVTELRAFLGTVGYYRQYIPSYAEVSKPLNRLTSAKEKWVWDDECSRAFTCLKAKLLEAPILCYPDPTKPYILDTDASDGSTGAVLSQLQPDGREGVIAYFSKALQPAEKSYCVTRKELLAVVKAMKHFRPYLWGRPCTVRTDHASLVWLCKRSEPSGQVARWLEILSEFQFIIEHRPGKKHGNADGLSRTVHQADTCKQCKRLSKTNAGPDFAQLAQEDDSPVGWKEGKLLPPVDLVCRAGPVQDQITELRELQSNSGDCVAKVYEALRDGTTISEQELKQSPKELKTLWDRRDALLLDDHGVLRMTIRSGGRDKLVAVCPTSIRRNVVLEVHTQMHAGFMRTLNRVKLQWYWPGMTSDVRRVVYGCEVCQVAKQGGQTASTGRRRLLAGRPWQLVAIDLVGPLPKTKDGNQWILVISDHFTRWCDGLAIPDATASTVARALDERVFCYLGIPEQLHSDQGAQFDGSLMHELCAIWGVEKSRTTPYHPQANGVVERNNRTLGDGLRSKLLGGTQDEWDRVLPHLMRSMRCLPHSVTRETPNQLMLGRELRLPDQLLYSMPPEAEKPVHEYAVQLVDNMQEAQARLRELQADLRTEDSDEPPLYEVGDYVLLENRRRRKGQNPKLQTKWVGPYYVAERFPNHTYLLEMNGTTTLQAECRLKRYRVGTDPITQAPIIPEAHRRPERAAMGPRRQRTTEVVPILIADPVPQSQELSVAEGTRPSAETESIPVESTVETRPVLPVTVDNGRNSEPVVDLPVQESREVIAVPPAAPSTSPVRGRVTTAVGRPVANTQNPVNSRVGRVSRPPPRLLDYVCSFADPEFGSDFC